MTRSGKIKFGSFLLGFILILLTILFVGYVDMAGRDCGESETDLRFFIKSTPSFQVEYSNPLRGEEKNIYVETMSKRAWERNVYFCKQRFGFEITNIGHMQHCLKLLSEDTKL